MGRFTSIDIIRIKAEAFRLITNNGITEEDIKYELQKKYGELAIVNALSEMKEERTVIIEPKKIGRPGILYKLNVNPSTIDLPQRSPQIMEGSEQLHSNIIKNEIGFGRSLPAFLSALPFANVIICDFHCMKQVGTA